MCLISYSLAFPTSHTMSFFSIVCHMAHAPYKGGFSIYPWHFPQEYWCWVNIHWPNDPCLSRSYLPFVLHNILGSFRHSPTHWIIIQMIPSTHCTFTHHGQWGFSHLPIGQRIKLVLWKSNAQFYHDEHNIWHITCDIHNIYMTCYDIHNMWYMLLSCAAQSYRVASLAEGTAALLMQCPLYVRTGIWNLFRVPAITRPHFDAVWSPAITWHCGILNVHQRMPAHGTFSLTSIQGTAQTLMNHSACKTPGWLFIAGLELEPRRDSLEVSVHTTRISC